MRFLTAVCALAPICTAQQFAQYPHYPVLQPLSSLQGRPERIAMADIDGDHLGDLAATANGGVYVLRNHGDQVWTSQLVMQAPCTAMAWADMDGDGDLDLVLGGSSTLSGIVPMGVLRNDGPTFKWLGQVDAPFGPGQVAAFAVGDVDGDRDLDLVVGGSVNSSGGPLLLVFRNDGRGRLAYDPGALPAMQGRSYEPVLIDVDGDGDLDLLAVCDGTTMVLFTNDGSGHFTDATSSLPPDRSARRLAVGDLDGDGRPDVVKCDGGAAVLWGSAGGLLPPQALAAGVETPAQIVLADVDGDGRADIVVRTSKGIEQRRNLGGRTFSLEVLMQGQSTTLDCAAGDTLGRGVADVLATFADGSHMLLVGSPAGLMVDHLPWLPALPVGPKAAGDIDGDGLDDVFQVLSTDTQVLHNLGRGAWSLPPRGAVVTSDVQRSVRLVDWNGDGRLDAITSGALGLQLLTCDAHDLVLRSSAPPIPLAVAGDLDVGDIDGDGKQDVLACSSQGAMLLFNTFAGSLPVPVLAPGTPPVPVTICLLRDLDGDGDRDLLLGSQSLGLAVFWNDGSGNFTAGPSLSLGGASPRSAVIADFDGDGRPDVAVLAGPALRWFRQLPGGTFTPGPAAATDALDPMELLAFDADDDGDQDLVLTGSRPRLLRNDGTGVFTLEGTTLGTMPLPQIIAVDLDQDGDLDLIGDIPLAGTSILENRARSAQSAHVPRLGGTLQVDFAVDPDRAAAATLLLPAGSLGAAPSQLVPGVRGTLLLGTPCATLPWVMLAAPAGTGSSITAVPPLAALLGAVVSIQGLTWSPRQDLGFTNVVDERIMP